MLLTIALICYNVFVNKEDISRWIRSIAISLIIFLFFSLYLILRRGYFNFYIANKVLGSSAVILAGATLLIGPLSKRFPFFTKGIMIRRHLGLLAFAFGLSHVTISVFVLNTRFPLSFYTNEWFPISFGVLAICVWTYMAYISRNTKIKDMGADVWKKRLGIAGQLAFLFIFLHLFIMKYEGWIRWFQGQVKHTPELANPSYPPASLFTLFFIVTVIVYRVLVFLSRKKG